MDVLQISFFFLIGKKRFIKKAYRCPLVHKKYTQEISKANPQQLIENRKRTPEPKKESPKQPTKEPNQTREKTHRPERIPTTLQHAGFSFTTPRGD
jgi:hypothetical protein